MVYRPDGSILLLRNLWEQHKNGDDKDMSYLTDNQCELKCHGKAEHRNQQTLREDLVVSLASIESSTGGMPPELGDLKRDAMNGSPPSSFDSDLYTIPEESPGAPPQPWHEGHLYPILGERLFFTAHRDDNYTLTQIKTHKRNFYFSSDLPERYTPFCADFGPCNIGLAVRFCREIHCKVTHEKLLRRPLIYYCSTDNTEITNTVFCLAAYLVLVHKKTAEEAFLPFAHISPSPLLPFRDATFCPSTFDLSVLDCLRGLSKAVELGWFDYDTFDVADYEFCDHPAEFNMNVMCPKFIAFVGPVSAPDNVYEHRPEDYVEEFKARGVSAVIRLNEDTTYDSRIFLSHGFKHYDMCFQDCSIPGGHIIEKFLDACDSAPGVVAVHCLAGLGRTGTLMGIWMIKHMGFKANEVIGWLRLMRPGSVIGPQQAFLKQVEKSSWDGNRIVWPQGTPEQCRAEASQLMATQVTEALHNRSARTARALREI